MTSYEIRKSFLEFFSTKNHQVVSSAPLVIKDDPTLMFTNAGMNQFKDIFLGVRPAKYPRVADTQKCLRVSGKHNDLEEVGYDTYHHTMFEMLGNWSLGDPAIPDSGYFKEEAIAWAWELLTSVYKIDKNKLYVTVFEGDKVDNLEKDLEAYNCWKKYIAEDRILLGNKKDNFWEMGDVGPCGPCSEIHIDIRPDEERKKIDGRTLVNMDHPQVVEVWNLVFMQYNRKADGSLVPLPQKHVDTGMGFERLCMALQGKISNYDTDVFQPLIQFIAKESGKEYGSNEKADIAMRVMADHIRAIAFTIADGQLPSNVGAGYVIRRILRRAARYAFTFLDIKEPFLYRLTDVLANQFKDVFPELYSQLAFVKKVIKEEESSFLRTLASGIQRFEKYTQGETEISGDFAFELYDTFGFPIDLTQLLAREKGLAVDMGSYQQELQKQKDRSRSATAIIAGDWVVLDASSQSEFVGYDDLLVRTRLIKYREVETKKKKQYQLVLARTPFYPEGGGQVGDTGLLEFGEEKIKVLDTRKENDLIIHLTEELPSSLNGEVKAVVDTEKRFYTASNHTATHLLQSALRAVLGDHIQQKGSLVNDQYLRFDFSHFSKMNDEEIRQVEVLVNDKIRENIPLDEQRALPIEKAKQLGATALFGEKYGDTVRMITFDPGFSRELCGGTHVQATGMIGFFKIISEGAVQAGVRRIEAITGVAALNYVFNIFDNLKELKELLKNPKNIVGSVLNLVEENAQLKKDLEKAVVEKAVSLKNELKEIAENINGINFIAQQVDLPSADAVKNLAYGLKSTVDDLFLVLAAEIDGKAHLSVMISEGLVKSKNLNAGIIVRELGKEIQGGGGGQAFFATAGGKNAKGLKNALEKARRYIA